MKKKVLLLGLFIGFLCTVITYFVDTTSQSKKNDLLLANIEALTNDEDGSGNWLKGYKMNSMHVYVGISGGVTVGVSKDSQSFGAGVTVEFKQIYCCERDEPGTDCNKNGNYSECSYLSLY